MLDKIYRTITERGLVSDGETVMAALSGGADSVCLTHALHALSEKLGIKLCAAHVNHGIRGAEADRDEAFAAEFCKRLGIGFYVLHADIPREAHEKGISEETAGRQARYAFFERLRNEYGIDKTATAHNKNDSAETVLMNLIRGSSLDGLCGIPYKRGSIIRPLLDIQRSEIERYCAENKLEYVTDSTNGETVYTRNKIRRVLIPLINSEFNANFIDTVCRGASLMRDDSDYLKQKAAKEYARIVRGNGADMAELKSLDAALRGRVIRRMIENARKDISDISSVSVRDIERLLYKNSGAYINLPDGITAKIEYGRLVIGRRSADTEPFSCELKVGGSVYVPQLSKEVQVTFANKRKKDGAVYLSCGADARIVVRNRREGDIFMPFGMNGSKKVKNYFIDNKVPRSERALVPIIEIDGMIAAVGDRVDRRFAFSEGGVRVEYKDKSQEENKV